MNLRSFAAVAILALAGLGGGLLLERHVLSTGGLGAAPPGRTILYWWDPMLPTFRSNRPGKSPMGMEMVPVYEGAENAGGPGGDAGIVTVSSATAHNLAIRTAPAKRVTMSPTVEAFGTVGFDESRVSHVHVRAKGWVERLNARVEGQVVARGDLLFEIFSPELISAASEFTRELQRGGTDVVEISRRKLLALGLAERQIADLRQTRQIPERIQVFAPRSGAVARLNLAEGMFIQPDMTLMSITEIDSVWVMAEILESQAALVRTGMNAEVRAPAAPGRTWNAVVDYVYPDLRPETRTLRVRLRLANTDRMLKPNMIASVRFAGVARDGVLAIPAEALIRTGHGDRVVLAMGEGRFKPVPLKVGAILADQVEVLDGLKEGDLVVASAQFLLDSESSMTGGLQRMSSAGGPDRKGPEAGSGIGNPDEPIWTDATANGAVTPDGMVNLSHPPIPAIGWPAMTMDFPMDPRLPASVLEPGTRLRVALARNPDGTFRVVAVEPAGAAGTAGAAR